MTSLPTVIPSPYHLLLGGVGGKGIIEGLDNNNNDSVCVIKPDDAATVPPYSLQAVWWVLWLVCVEYLALWWQGAKLPCIHDNLLSFAHATFYEITKLLVRGVEFGSYTWVWRNYGLFPAPPDTLLTIIGLVVLIDLGYYWLHRANHEIMFLWAIHQVHHSSQDLTVAVGLRHSPIQRLFSWVFYLPLALLGVPPAYMLAHLQFNLLYQCWIHTEAVSTLGPLEYIFNTPQHHRVHHGCNMYCLDKNYGGVFIFWDYLFGTFQWPVKGEETVYGILVQPESFNILYNQVFYLKAVVEKALTMDNKWDGLMSTIKGPSWVPGAPWTGFKEDKPDVKAPREYMPAVASPSTHLYVLAHLMAAVVITATLTHNMSGSPVCVFVYSMVVVAALTCTGILYEQPSYTWSLEVWRCAGGLVLCLLMPLPASSVLTLLTALYAGSLLVWLFLPGLVLCPPTVVIAKEVKED